MFKLALSSFFSVSTATDTLNGNSIQLVGQGIKKIIGISIKPFPLKFTIILTYHIWPLASSTQKASTQRIWSLTLNRLFLFFFSWISPSPPSYLWMLPPSPNAITINSLVYILPQKLVFRVANDSALHLRRIHISEFLVWSNGLYDKHCNTHPGSSLGKKVWDT